jgi:FkbM family methyltransferase
MKLLIRDSIAKFFRTLPPFKGKNKVGIFFINLLTNYQSDQECIVTFGMRDRGIMRIDLRTFERQAFFTGEYDYGIIQRLSSILKPGCTVLDVGANIGFYSIALGLRLKQLSSGAQLWAIEPITSNFKRLVEMIDINELEDIVKPVNCAFGNQEGEVLFHLESKANSETGNAVWIKESNANFLQTNCISYMTKLDDFAIKNHITSCELIKLDIEGAELEFLQGASEFVSKFRPIIFSEFNPYWVQTFKYSFEDLCDFMTLRHYHLYKHRREKNDFVSIQEPLTKLSNFIMIPEEKLIQSLFEKLGMVN